MGRKGGYKIIDFKGENFVSGTGKTVSGLFNNIAETDKRIVMSGVSVGGKAFKDFEVNFALVSSKYTATVVLGGSSTTITVDNGDEITFTISQ